MLPSSLSGREALLSLECHPACAAVGRSLESPIFRIDGDCVNVGEPAVAVRDAHDWVTIANAFAHVFRDARLATDDIKLAVDPRRKYGVGDVHLEREYVEDDLGDTCDDS